MLLLMRGKAYTGLSSSIRYLKAGVLRQPELHPEVCARQQALLVKQVNAAVISLDQGSHDEQPQTETIASRRVGGLEDQLRHRRADTRTVVRNDHATPFSAR